MSTAVASNASRDDLHSATLFSMDGLVVLITGGGTGIGLIIAKTLATNGAKVYIVGRRQEVLEKTAREHTPPKEDGGVIIALPGDVSDKDSISKLVKTVDEKEGQLHVLINNAGIAGPKNEVDPHDDKGNAEHIKECLWNEQDFEGWGNTFATNVSALYFTSTGFLPLLQEAGKRTNGFSPTIINISSISGLTKLSQNHMAYNASKAAAIQLTRMMATEFTDAKIRVNTIAPGLFPSEMTTGDKDDKNVSEIDKKHHTPAARAGRATDMAGVALLLASKAGIFLNGVVLPVDGGSLLVKPSAY